MAVLLGVKVTLCTNVPAAGVLDGVVHAKVPATLADPPVKSELASVSP